MYKIDNDLREWMASGVVVTVATGSSDGRPHAVYGWAPRVREDGVTVDIYLDTLRAETTLANLRNNGRIAMTMGHPVTYRSVQLKGRFRDTDSPDADEVAWVQQGREAVSVTTSLVGDPPETIANLWLDEVVRVTFTAEQAFDQTPGPEAGKPL